MVGSAVAMIVWSSAARNIASRMPIRMVRISAWLNGWCNASRADWSISTAQERSSPACGAPVSRPVRTVTVAGSFCSPRLAGLACTPVDETVTRRSRPLASLPDMPSPRAHLTLAQARRIALAAQGLAEARPGVPGPRHRARTLDRSHLLQIDSVNVLVRAHYMPLFSRLGPYERSLVDSAAYRRKRRGLFEYWGHEASLIRIALHPLFRWRMERAARGEGIYGGLARFEREQRDFITAVRREIETRGPLSAGELEGGGKGRGSWWGWSEGKRALEWLFWAGQVTTAFRRGFERVYDLPERVLPAEVLEAPTPSPEGAQRALLKHSIRALGVASERFLRDYFRL